MSPEEIKIKRGVIAELRTLLKKLDAESIDSELNPPAPESEIEIIVPAPDKMEEQMPNPNQLDPKALDTLNKTEEEPE